MFKLFRCTLIGIVIAAASFALIAAMLYPPALIGVVVVTLWKSGMLRRRSTDHGTARWADVNDVEPMLGGHGLILGRMQGRIHRIRAIRLLFNFRLSSREACQRFLATESVLRLNNTTHVAAFSPTGGGKGVSLVIPHLLTCPDSMVVVDFKGENCRLTARARRAMGHRVVILDPYHITTREPDTFNPLDFIDKDSVTALDDCRDLAEALVVQPGQEKEPHWAQSAEAWIASMIALVVTKLQGEGKSLQTVRTLLTDPEKMQAAIRAMCLSDEMDGMLSRLGHQLTQFKDKELASTLTTVQRFMRFLDTTVIAESTQRSSFDPADLLRGKMTIYLVLPPDRVRAQSPLLRLWISSFLRAVIRGGLQETTPVRFILDEAASLGHMGALDDAVDKLRAYGVRLLFLWQSLGQLHKCFPEGQEQTLLSNVTQIFFGVQDQQTSEYVSSRLGETTITTESGGTSLSTTTQQSMQGETSSRSTSTNRNWQYMARKLLKPEEVTALSERVAITFTPGVPPIATRLLRYYEKDFKKINGMGLLQMTWRTASFLISVLVVALIILAFVLQHAPH